MEIYLIDETNNYFFRYPVSPLKEISMTKKKRYTTHDIIDFGPIDLYKPGEEMQELEFDTLFPGEYDASYCNYSDLPNPYSIINKFDEFRDLSTPLRLIINDFNFNELVYLSEYTYKSKAGESDDLYITNKFRKYREANISASNSSYSLYSRKSDNLTNLLQNRVVNSNIIKAGDSVKINTKSINIRDNPDFNASVIGRATQGQVAKIVRVQNKTWGCIPTYGQAAWIDLSDVVKVDIKDEE